jgi:N-methylhydantoinase A
MADGFRLGVDIGGTFTDFSLWDEATGRVHHHKSPTIPSDPSVGVQNGLAFLEQAAGVDPARITYFIHGTTVGVNTVLQRNGASLSLFVTAGFKDILELQRLRLAEPVNYRATRPEPLIPRSRVFEISERVLADGSVDVPLDRKSVVDAIQGATASGVEGIVVCLVNAYRNDVHERAIRAIVDKEAPGLYVCCSHEVWPQMREYERAVVTILNAYIRPKVVDYLDGLTAGVTSLGLRTGPLITKSNGGAMPISAARITPVETLLSGPASGVVGAIYAAGLSGLTNLLTLDIGGTSADIAVVREGEPTYSREEHIGDFPVIMPAVAITSIGAGGGSVARADASGLLRVGPDSAGADPGPACYGRGGTAPTLTDAFLISGVLNPGNFAGGQIKLRLEPARAAMERLANALDMSPDATANAVISVALAGMYAEFSQVLTRHGIDPREFTLVAYGGAGPLLACLLASEFHIARVLIPRSPGTLCALGALSADLKNDHVRSVNLRLSEDRMDEIRKQFDELALDARASMNVDPGLQIQRTMYYSADMRYHHQAYEIELPIDANWLVGAAHEDLLAAFHSFHQRLYGHADHQEAVDLINLHVKVVGAVLKPKPTPVHRAGQAVRPVHRAVRLRDRLYQAEIHQRRELSVGQRVVGPAIIEQDDTTVLIPADFSGTVDTVGNILIIPSIVGLGHPAATTG